MIIIGADPGKTGALGMLDLDSLDENTVQVCPLIVDTPIVTRLNKTKASGRSTEYDVRTMVEVVETYTEYALPTGTPMIAMLERVSSRPGEGVSSVFNFGYGFGLWHGIFASVSGLDVRFAPPQVWKRKFGLLKKDKDASRLLALEKFPILQPQLKRKKDHGRAEALLIALYCMLSQYGWDDVEVSSPLKFGDNLVMRKRVNLARSM